MTPRFRRSLASHPRVVLAVLLAFGIEIVPPPAGLVSHRHASDGAHHTHAGRIVGAAQLETRTAAADASGRDQIRPATTRDLHAHHVHPFVALRAPVAPPLGPTLLAFSVSFVPALADSSAASRATQARAPPSDLV